MKYEIKKLGKEDISSLVQLLEKVFFKNISIEGVSTLVDNINSIDLIAKIDDKVVGHAMVDINEDVFTDDKFLYLNYFCVDPDYRRMGIGESLIKELEKYALENNISYMKFTSGNKRVDAHHFYKNKGYVIKDTSVFIKYFK